MGMKAGSLIRPGRMRAGSPDPQKRISFSFRHIERDHQKFRYSQCEAAYFCKVIERLSAVSDFTVQEIHSGRSNSLRAHPIVWNTTSEPEGFQALNEQLRGSPPYQFSVSSNAHGRVHGFFLDHVFYVVWLDPSHCLYP